MPRRGLVAAPDGWVQIIRGPRPPSVKWPAASEGSGTTKKQGVVGVPRSQARGRWRQPFAQVSFEVSFEAAQRRVAQLESALRALGDAKGPEVAVLQESFKAAKRAAQVPPVKVQLIHCEQFVARAEKRLAIHDEERITLVKQLEDGKQRLLKLREEVSQSPAPASAPVQPTDWGAQVASLQQMVNTLQSERDALAAQIQGEKADVLSHGIVARRHAQQGVGPGHIPVMPTMVPGELSQWLEDRQEDLKDAFARDDDIGVLELTSKMAQGAERLIQLTRQPGTTDDELVLRGAPGEGRFAPY